MQFILEKFVRQIDNFSIRKKMIFIYIFCMILPITLTDGVIIYGSAYRSTAAQI